MAKAKTDNKPEKTEPGAEVRKGDVVWWWLRGMTDNPPAAAIVVEKRSDNLMCLEIFSVNGTFTKDGVRHRSDPELNTVQRERNGCWAVRG